MPVHYSNCHQSFTSKLAMDYIKQLHACVYAYTMHMHTTMHADKYLRANGHAYVTGFGEIHQLYTIVNTYVLEIPI